MTTTRTPPYRHADGSNCWTKDCSRRGSEISEKESFFNQVKEKSKSVTPVFALPPLSAFMEALKARRIDCSRHATLPYITFKYSRDTQFAYDWDEVTMASRGIIFNEETGEVLARPFAKFFNYNEPTAPTEKMTGNISVTEKLDGCFTSRTRLNLWDGGTITIGEVVKNQLTPTLIGMDEEGNLVPTKPINWFNNGRKTVWMNIFLDSPTDKRSGSGGHPTRMQVTPNHHLFVNGEYISAIEAKIGDKMVGQTYSLDERAIHFIKSALLGDGCVTQGGKNAKFQESHSISQEEYIFYMRDILAAVSANRTDTVSGYGSDMKWVGTREYELLNEIRKEWYVDGKKVIPTDLSWMDDFTVAKWYMDDGSLAHNSKKYQQDRALFSTNGFTEEEVNRLGEKLVEMYGISYTAYFSKGWTLRVNAGRDSSINRMWESLAPHIHPSLQYKLPEQFRNVSEFIPFDSVKELRENKDVTITKIEMLPVSETAQGIFAFDIGTETENYMVNGVIVHNSLGISYEDEDGRLNIATAGSFKSPQALYATKLYQDRYEGNWTPNPKLTYMWEILYPENRVVVDYGDTNDIFLIGAVNKRTGRSIPVADVKEWKWNRAESFEMNSLNDVVSSGERLNHEGFIVHYTDTDVRVKYKHDDYLRLHRVATGVTAKTIWNKMKQQEDMNTWKKDIPEEFLEFINERQTKIQSAFDVEVQNVQNRHAQFKATLPEGYTRKEFAIALNKTPEYKKDVGYIMNIENSGKPYSSFVQANRLWDRVKPQDETTAWNM